MNDEQNRAFLAKSLRLIESCNRSALVILDGLERTLSVAHSPEWSNRALARKYVHEIAGNYQNSEASLSGLERYLRHSLSARRGKASAGRVRRERPRPNSQTE